MLRTVILSAAAITLAVGLTACDSADERPSAKPEPAAPVAPVTPVTPSGFKYDDVNEYVNEHLPAGHPMKGTLVNNTTLDDSYRQLCVDIDGVQPNPAYRSAFASTVVKSTVNVVTITERQGGTLFDTIVAGCRATGHSALSKPAQPPYWMASLDQVDWDLSPMPRAIIVKRVKAGDCTWLQDEYDGIDSTGGAVHDTWVETHLPLALAEVIDDLDSHGDCR